MTRNEIRAALNKLQIKPRELAKITGLSRDVASSLAQNREVSPFWFETLLWLLADARPELVQEIRERAAQQTEWRTVQGFPAYEVSEEGGVRRPMARGTRETRGLKPKVDRSGYKVFGFYSGDGKQRWRQLHRIVCIAFHGAPTAGKNYACHKNGIKEDNRAANLYWGSASENARDTVAHRLIAQRRRGTNRAQQIQEMTAHHPQLVEYAEEVSEHQEF